jgi:uncharacterized protein (TIGR03435 family)
VAGTDAPVSELASFLSRILDRPVTDATALKGRYEFIFGFTVASLPSGRFAGIASMVSDPPDAEPAPALLSVLQDRFGLKLDKKKGPIDFFVIDHVERVPTEN